MKWKLLENRPGSWAAIVAVLVLFVGVGFAQYGNVEGQDLASSFVGARLLAQGLGDHLFSYDTKDFAEIGDDDTWTDVAQLGGFNGYVHPYVQTPLWAFLLKPLAQHVNFLLFNWIFAGLSLLTFAGAIWLTAKYWAPSFFNPWAIAVVCTALMLAQPFQYAMYLNQTHMLLMFLTVAALILAERGWPVMAGLLLAYAASVKVTPGLLIVYWVVTRRWSAAASAAVWSAVLWFATVAAVGHDLMHVYTENLQRISRVLLVSQNNQSFAAWLMARFYSPDAVWDIDILPLPTAVRLGSSALMLVCTVWGGWLDWRRRRDGVENAAAPLGAMMAILAATIFAPIAWTHYSIVLFMPVMLLVEVNRQLRRWWLGAVIAVVMLLNYRPIATDIIHGLIGTLAVVRGQFYACALALVGLAAAAHLQLRRSAPALKTTAARGAFAA